MVLYKKKIKKDKKKKDRKRIISIFNRYLSINLIWLCTERLKNFRNISIFNRCISIDLEYI